MYLGTLLRQCLWPKWSSFTFSPAFRILATPQDPTGAVKVPNLHASKLDTFLMEGYPISSV